MSIPMKTLTMGDDTFKIIDSDAREALNFDKSATQGYILTASNEGKGSQWSPVGLPTDEQTADAVSDWLDNHPEATTTVEDGSVSKAKLATTLQNEIDGKSDALDTGYYDEVTFEKGRYDGCDYYIATVPYLDDNNEKINLYMAYDANKNPLEQAVENGTTLTMNGYASVYISTDQQYHNAIAIGNGVVLNSQGWYPDLLPDIHLYLGITQDRVIHEYKMNSNITAQDMLENGDWNVTNCYFKLVEDSEMIEFDYYTYSSGTVIYYDQKGVPMLMGITADKDILFMCTDGRTAINSGLSVHQAGQIMIAKGCTDVYVLDGGQSTVMAARGSKLNRSVATDGYSFRDTIHYTLNVKKESENEAVLMSTGKVGVEKQRIVEQIMPNITYLQNNQIGYIDNLLTKNIDEFPAKGIYGTVWLNCNADTVEGTKPYNTSQGLLFTLKQSTNYARQVYICTTTNNVLSKSRAYTYASDTWSAWVVNNIGHAQELSTYGIVGDIAYYPTQNIDLFPEYSIYGMTWLSLTSEDILGTKPSETGHGILFTAKQSDSHIRQIFIGVTIDCYKARHYTVNTESWGAWDDLKFVDNIGVLSNLKTTAKSSLVAAINELYDELHPST